MEPKFGVVLFLANRIFTKLRKDSQEEQNYLLFIRSTKTKKKKKKIKTNKKQNKNKEEK